MAKEIKARVVEQKAIPPDQIGIKIEAAFIEDDEGMGFRIPEAIFEIRLGVEHVYTGLSDETGIFTTDEIVLNCQDNSTVDIEITADDLTDKSRQTIRVNIGDALQELRGTPEKQRQLKQSLVEARIKLMERGCQTGDDWTLLIEHMWHPLITDPFILEIAKRRPVETLKALSHVNDTSWAKLMVEFIATNSPDVALSNVETYEYYPWARSAVEIATTLSPQAAIVHYELYNLQPWALEVYEKAQRLKSESDERKMKEAKMQREAKMLRSISDIESRIFSFEAAFKDDRSNREMIQERDEFVKALEILVQNQAHPTSKRVAIRIAMYRPDIIFNYRFRISEAEWMLEVMEMAAKELINRDNSDYVKKLFRSYGGCFNGYPGYSILADVREFKDETWAEELISWAISVYYLGVQSCFDHLKRYVDKPWSKNIFLVLAKKESVAVLAGLDAYKNQPWAREVLIVAACEKPESAFSLPDSALAKDILIAAASENPLQIILHSDRFGASPLSREVLKVAIDKEPRAALQFRDRFENLPWASGLIETTRGNVERNRYRRKIEPSKEKIKGRRNRTLRPELTEREEERVKQDQPTFGIPGDNLLPDWLKKWFK